jgi:AraC-like DNA-binding protein
LSGPLTIHSLAARFNVSPTALKESFHRVYGRSIHRYIRSVRLDAAAKMLLDTTLEVRQISRAVGYSSPSQFTNAFKYRYGMAPGQYRRNKNVI